VARGNIVRFGLLALLWGSSFLFIAVALDGLSPLQIVLSRMCIGAVVLLAVIAGQRLRLPRERALWGHLVIAALIANVIPYFLFAWAEQSVPSNVAGALNATTPLFTLGLAVALRQEQRSTGARLLGLVIGFLGALLVLAPWQESGALGSRSGQLACLLAAASYAVSYIYMGRFIAGAGIPPLVLSASQLSMGALLLLLTAPLYAAAAVELTLPVVASVLALGALGTGAAYILNYRLLQDEGATTASVVNYFLPIVAVVLGVLVLGEPLTWNLVAGAALVLLGMAIAQGRLQLARARALTR
jgi:drug/metabolite transporter (DMT)-like permease